MLNFTPDELSVMKLAVFDRAIRIRLHTNLSNPEIQQEQMKEVICLANIAHKLNQ